MSCCCAALNFRQEACTDSQLTVSVSSANEVCGVIKGGAGSLPSEQLLGLVLKAVKLAGEVFPTLYRCADKHWEHHFAGDLNQNVSGAGFMPL